MYVSSFERLRSYPYIRTAADELEFTEALRTIYDRHNNVVPVLAMAVGRLRDQHGELVNREMPEIHRFLDDFYLSRIGMRMLIGKVGLSPPPQLTICVGWWWATSLFAHNPRTRTGSLHGNMRL